MDPLSPQGFSYSRSRLSGLITLWSLCLFGCAAPEEALEDAPVEVLYAKGQEALKANQYKKAAHFFSELDRQHPYSPLAVQAQLKGAYALYEAKNYDEAIGAFHTFVQLHPAHESTPYAYYMIALCHYEQIPIVHRTQEPTEKCAQAFEELIHRFPDSPYARDARFKRDLIIDHLAGKEMTVGRYYLNQRSYIAALNRFDSVLKQYQTSSHVPEALHRSVECSVALGLADQARKSLAVLGYNYPKSLWYQDSYTLMKEKNLLPTSGASPQKPVSSQSSPQSKSKNPSSVKPKLPQPSAVPIPLQKKK